MIARVTLDLALGKEFDYLIPAELAAQVEVGTRVKAPFAHRQVSGALPRCWRPRRIPISRPLLKVIGRQSHVSPAILRLARWMGEYYCCAPEVALRTVLPEAVRKEKEGWREQLFVRALPQHGPGPKLSRRQEEILELARAHAEAPLQELLRATGAAGQTVRRLEDKGLLAIAPKISERDPYARRYDSADAKPGDECANRRARWRKSAPRCAAAGREARPSCCTG